MIYRHVTQRGGSPPSGVGSPSCQAPQDARRTRSAADRGHPEWPFGRILASIRTSCREPLDVAVTLRDATQRDHAAVGAPKDTRTTGVTGVPNSFIVIRDTGTRGASDCGRAETRGAQ